MKYSKHVRKEVHRLFPKEKHEKVHELLEQNNPVLSYYLDIGGVFSEWVHTSKILKCKTIEQVHKLAQDRLDIVELIKRVEDEKVSAVQRR